MPPSGTSSIAVLEGGSQGGASARTAAYWVVREASGATKKWRQATSDAETVRRPWHLKRESGNAADDPSWTGPLHRTSPEIFTR
jgi:hypothetical protein